METDTFKTEQNRNIESASSQTKDAMSHAYERTNEILTNTYDQAMTYARENPGKTTLIAVGIGVGLGLLLASGGRRSRIRRYGEPIVNALSDIALEVIRGL
jgi:ElaB protein